MYTKRTKENSEQQDAKIDMNKNVYQKCMRNICVYKPQEEGQG
jgi:hypothetical protein